MTDTRADTPSTVVLAYSGGLDTSVCIPLLRERYGVKKVVTVLVDVGQPASDIERGNLRAEKLSDEHYHIDAREEFVNDYIFPLIKANGSYEGYVLGTAIARPLIAKKTAQVAERLAAEALAHGCTGRGNDQLRFEAVFRATKMKVIAPMRDLDLAREWEIEYAREHGIDVPVTKERPWSIDENIWSRSIEGGHLEDPFFEPPEEIYSWTKSPSRGLAPEIVEIEFQEGVPVALNGQLMNGMDLIARLNSIAGEHGVGRTDMVEDRVLGLKARENYEHPAATVLLTAHRDLELLVLSRNELRFKAGVDAAWSEMAYMGLVDDPFYADLNAFIDQASSRVNGTVRMKLHCGSAISVGRKSPDALYSQDMVSFDSHTLSQRDAEGFAKYHGFQARLLRHK
ncbi:MAG: argininosuccinate synthase [Methanosaeta sp. PtaB.Bin039]|nr:MAG: argininosuccinate synthase [Methanosaeta sp. PtaB.Bin039]OPY44520.1 MAG: argininosuccinate synthase [Methanosaeta sp. PtaU1.Bin028]HOT06593.1 argininosuccinate synthase [Methanotrichaceae archaeon]HQF16525.1 argininosuccinate synthase [Methanotrichaceae archaeon]HQI91104.1 argininosuccinate synthase [Methanotrichaceae archaeon]